MPDKEFITEWLRHAGNDLISAHHLFEDLYPKQTEIAAYHSQQCAEKSLKAFLVAHDIEPPRIHNLKRLCELCENIAPDFSVLEDDSDKLNPFGSEVRYPNELAADETAVKTAIKRAQRIYDFCTQKIDELIQRNNN